MSSNSKLRLKIYKEFKRFGYYLRPDAEAGIQEFVRQLGEANENSSIETFSAVLRQEIGNDPPEHGIITKEPVNIVKSRLLSRLSKGEPAIDEISWVIVDSFVMPKFEYDLVQNKFCEYKGELPFFGGAKSRISFCRDRYWLLLQRIACHPDYSIPALCFDFGIYPKKKRIEICSIHPRIKGVRCIMGAITQLEGRLSLRDLYGSLEVDFSKAKSTAGYLVENTIIVAEGEVSNDIFQVSSFWFPPLENREDRFASLRFLERLDYFGGGFLSADKIIRLKELEKKATNEMFIIISDVWLDDEETMRKLGTLLDVYDSQKVVPSVFVLMGNFCSRRLNNVNTSFLSLRSQFGKLGEMIAARSNLNIRSRFLFIPGPDDAGPSTALPRHHLCDYLTEELRNHVRDANFSSNPCRIMFYTQEIVFFRQDLLSKMRRSSLIPPPEDAFLFKHLVATILQQSHLCPLPLTVQPIIWNYDHCLRLYPTPHTIALGDRSEQKELKEFGVTCFNTGSFANDSTYVAYHPHNQKVELSAL